LFIEKIIVNLQTQNNSVKKSYIVYTFCQKKSFKRVIAKQIKNKMKKGIHPENYRLVVLKTCQMKKFLSLNLLQIQEKTLTVDGVEYPVVKWRSLELHPFTQVNLNLLITAGRIDKFKTKYAKHAKIILFF
jgi:large subunit ribosomal protein L31